MALVYYMTAVIFMTKLIEYQGVSAGSECRRYTVLNTADRDQARPSGHILKCDKNDLTKKWYRFSGAAGSALPTTCVAKNHCGTHAPGWMQGSHPTQAQGIVTRRVCYHWNSNCCLWHNNVRVRNCGGFYVYELDKPPHCHLRYCGNGQVSECNSYTVLNQADRAKGFFSKGVLKCDKNDLTKKWYRFSGAAGSALPTTCVAKNHCGTHAPGWMQGSHPTQAQGIVTRRVCYHWSSNCCHWHNNVRVRNCGGFYVYELDKPPHCHLRYCGSAGQAPTLAPSVPQECKSYTVLRAANRAQGFSSSLVRKCDKNDLSKKWYRFTGAAGSAMPTSCVPKNRCGTHAPGWMEGSHPTQAQGIVSRKVCYHWSSKCCHWNNMIRVRNCGGFYVYELDRTPQCNLRYCGNGGGGGVAPTTTPPQPSECRSYTVLNQADRAKGFFSKAVLKCDKNDLTKKWYRFSGAAGSALPTTCVAKNHCGTHAPGWMQGSHPTQAQGIVSRKVCYHWSSNCCHWNNNIRVRNCGGFYVYELDKPPHCHLRYCGSDGQAPTAPATVPPIPTTVQPPVPQECRSYTVLNEGDRAQGFFAKHVLKCDKNNFSKKWYRFSGAAGSAMASSCVPKNRCGTHAPGWMEGSHPTQAQGIVSRRVCFTWSGKCCHWNANIRVRSCGAFYVYELDKTRFCHLRYCGNGGPAPTTAPPIPTTVPNPCLAKPCKNGGKCVQNGNGYTCTCAQGYTGKNCDQDVNECLKSPCRNGATCSNTKGGYNCRCTSGFQGKNCDLDIDECRKNPCQNNGRCQNNPGSYTCYCPIGFIGKNCETDINECLRNPCRNGGTCRNTKGGYTCTCRSGYQGKNCEQDVNECLKRPCQNGGTCKNINGGYTCTCRTGYQGKNCGQDVNECLKNPCQNGGTCRNTKGGYTCTCRTGYQGKNCDQDVNECLKNPCQNGGSCSNTNGGYTCDCRPGYQGKDCDQDVNECLKTPCQNGGSCLNKPGSYSCECRPGFQGKNCEQDIDECLGNPCQNGGTCRNTNGSYACTCRKGFEGNDCENDINECLKDPCQNGGTCRNTNGGYKCVCASGFRGLHCDQDVDECVSGNPCNNGATCVNNVGGYTCSCTPGFTGKDCDEDVNECAINPCQNGGRCTNLPGSYRCQCLDEFTGKHCESEPSKPTIKPGQADYSGIGCYKDNGGNNRPFPKLVVNLRPGIDWNDLKTTVIDKCANAVHALGYKYFGIQFYGECWSGPDASVQYDIHGKDTECYVGVGAAGANYVYKIA